FDHEQARPDRDNYVRVIWENVQLGQEHNFDKYNSADVDTLNTPYDYGSLLHYPSNYFSVNGGDTLVSLNPGITLGQRDTLSPLDIQAIRTFYGCSASITTTTTPSTTTNTTPSITTNTTPSITTSTTAKVTTTKSHRKG
ncbi:unnamed protein product, partial [Rotaria sordida]